MSDPLFPRRYTIHRTSGDTAEVLTHITATEADLPRQLEEISGEHGEPVSARPVRITARDIARIVAQARAE